MLYWYCCELNYGFITIPMIFILMISLIPYLATSVSYYLTMTLGGMLFHTICITYSGTCRLLSTSMDLTLWPRRSQYAQIWLRWGDTAGHGKMSTPFTIRVLKIFKLLIVCLTSRSCSKVMRDYLTNFTFVRTLHGQIMQNYYFGVLFNNNRNTYVIYPLFDRLTGVLHLVYI